MSKTIVFVDDEDHVLHALRRAFMETDYIVHTVGSAAEALALMEKEKTDLVVSDMRVGHPRQTLVKTQCIIIHAYCKDASPFCCIQNGPNLIQK